MQQLESNRRKVAIIGVGSPFGADRLGWRVIDALEQCVRRNNYPEIHIEFIQADRPNALLLPLFDKADAAVVIDAMQAGLPPGTVRILTPDQLNRESGFLSSHGFGVAESIALGASLGQLPESLTIIGIEMGDDMSDPSLVQLTSDALLLLIEDLLSSIQRRHIAAQCERG